jgi:hypothetical protein
MFKCLSSLSSFSRFPTSLMSCNGHAPLIIQEGRARAGQNVQPRQDGLKSYLNSSLAQGKGWGGRESVSQGCCRTLKHLAKVSSGSSWFSFPLSSHLLTSLRSCNGHAPLIIQEGRARAGQNVQRRRDGQNSDLNSTKHTEMGK